MLVSRKFFACETVLSLRRLWGTPGAVWGAPGGAGGLPQAHFGVIGRRTAYAGTRVKEAHSMVATCF